jgi:hypothetical protein
MKEKGAVDIYLHEFLTSTLQFHSGMSPWCLLNEGLVGYIIGLGSVEKRYRCFRRELNLGYLIVQPAA